MLPLNTGTTGGVYVAF